jgi:hypothetical protein
VRWLLFLLLVLPFAARADEVDLTRSSGKRFFHEPPTWVVRLEGGSAFSPAGYVGGVVSWFDNGFELEAGAGAGIPGLQLGLAARSLFAVEDQSNQFVLFELAVAGNTRVDRNNANAGFGIAGQTQNSLWTSLGFGAELRQDFYSFDVVASIVFTTESLTPYFAVHGGVGFGF